MADVIPTLPLSASASQAASQIASQIEQACRSTGFFYLVPPDSIWLQATQAFAQSKAFFELPTATKLQIERSAKTNCGYVPLGSEALNPNRASDCKEALNLGLANLGANAWPAELRSFQAGLEPFYHACIQQVALPLLRSLALSLSLPAAFFTARHQQNFCLRLLHYPPLELGAEPESSAIRAGEHTDYGTITLLFQAGQGGLEILSHGDWLPVAPKPELILVNLGDAIQRWTNDRYRSTPHRVVSAPVSAPVSRYSMALFCDPDPAVEIACLPNCQNTEHPAHYAPIRYQDYLQSRFAATYGLPSRDDRAGTVP